MKVCESVKTLKRKYTFVAKVEGGSVEGKGGGGFTFTLDAFGCVRAQPVQRRELLPNLANGAYRICNSCVLL